MSDENKPERIHEVDISREALKNVKSIDDLKKTEIFSHLPADLQTSGYAQLWDEIKPAAVSSAAVSSGPTKVV